MPHSCGAPKRSRRVGVGVGIAIYLCVGICFGFEIGEVGSWCRCRSWSRWLSVAVVVVFLLFEVCPRPDSGRHYENKHKKLVGKNTHTDTENQAMCSIEWVPILNVEQFDLKSPAKKTTMKQQARPKKPTINFWGGCCCWHWLLKQTARARIMKNIAASGVKIKKK